MQRQELIANELYQRKVIGIKSLEDEAFKRLVMTDLAKNQLVSEKYDRLKEEGKEHTMKSLYHFGMAVATPGMGFIRSQYSYELTYDPRQIQYLGIQRIGTRHRLIMKRPK